MQQITNTTLKPTTTGTSDYATNIDNQIAAIRKANIDRYNQEVKEANKNQQMNAMAASMNKFQNQLETVQARAQSKKSTPDDDNNDWDIATSSKPPTTLEPPPPPPPSPPPSPKKAEAKKEVKEIVPLTKAEEKAKAEARKEANKALRESMEKLR